MKKQLLKKRLLFNSCFICHVIVKESLETCAVHVESYDLNWESFGYTSLSPLQKNHQVLILLEFQKIF